MNHINNMIDEIHIIHLFLIKACSHSSSITILYTFLTLIIIAFISNASKAYS